MGYFRNFAHRYRTFRRRLRSARRGQGHRHEAMETRSRHKFTQTPLTIGVVSTPGRSDKQNRDSYWLAEMYAPLPDGAVGEIIPVAIVASGVHDTADRPWASQLTVETIYAALRTIRYTPIQQRLVAAIQQARQVVAQRASASGGLAHDSADVVVAAFLYNVLYLAYTGECRTYLIRNGAIQPLTSGLSPAANTLMRPLTPKRQRPLRRPPPVPTGWHVGTTGPTILAPGQPATQLTPLAPHTAQYRLNAGDTLLLCTPGLHRTVGEQAMLNAVVFQSPQAAAQQLTFQAQQAGTDASCTVLVIQHNAGPAQEARPRQRWPLFYKALLAGCGLLLIVIQLFVFAQWGTPPPLAMNPVRATPQVTASAPTTAAPSTKQPVVQAIITAQQTPLPSPTSNQAPTLALLDHGAVSNAQRAAPPNETQSVPLRADQLWQRLALTTTLTAFSQNVATTIKAAGKAMAVARTATASAPTPTPSATATVQPTIPPTVPPTVPPPTFTPMRTVSPRRPSPTPSPTASPTATVQAVQPKRVDFTNATVKVLEPAEYDTLNDKRPFRWRPNFTLPAGFAFELVFWQRSQDPLKQGKGFGGMTREEQVNASYEHFHMRNAPEGEYRWGILLVSQEPYRRIKYLGGGRVIYVKQR